MVSQWESYGEILPIRVRRTGFHHLHLDFLSSRFRCCGGNTALPTVDVLNPANGYNNAHGAGPECEIQSIFYSSLRIVAGCWWHTGVRVVTITCTRYFQQSRRWQGACHKPFESNFPAEMKRKRNILTKLNSSVPQCFVLCFDRRCLLWWNGSILCHNSSNRYVWNAVTLDSEETLLHPRQDIFVLFQPVNFAVVNEELALGQLSYHPTSYVSAASHARVRSRDTGERPSLTLSTKTAMGKMQVFF